MKRDQPRMLLYGQMDRCYIADTDKYLGMPADRLKIKLVQHASRPITAASAPHDGRVGIGKSSGKLGGAISVGATQISRATINIAVKSCAKSSRMEALECSFDAI